MTKQTRDIELHPRPVGQSPTASDLSRVPRQRSAVLAKDAANVVDATGDRGQRTTRVAEVGLDRGESASGPGSREAGYVFRGVISGGIDHLNVQPDGSAWRCILEGQLGMNPLGNVYDPKFRLPEEMLRCRESWQCPACDRDKVTLAARA